MHSYKELVVWQKAMDLVVAIYELTKNYPSEEKFGLISQMRRAAVSIPSNIAEGRKRKTYKDYGSFLIIAYTSGAELETQIEISKRLSLGKDFDYSIVDGLLDEVMRMLNKMTNQPAIYG
ncbi:four helix bundle protein [Candidatus Falkowbacteria bacterium]|nr:four helix bundle protein [Candidatus Falkowbacteria bacterium]MBT7006920.1 four helix bundle protein [Candidatus Falkowbacteria bacterium]